MELRMDGFGDINGHFPDLKSGGNDSGPEALGSEWAGLEANRLGGSSDCKK